MTSSMLLVAALLAPFGSADARGSFFGMQSWSTPSAAEFMTMGRGGVGTYRAQLNWGRSEPSPGERDWSRFDEVVAGATAAKIKVLPYVSGSPPWLTGDATNPPVRSEAEVVAWREFLADAVGRYGPGGEFWRERPGLNARPIRTWQLWNEPNLPAYWFEKPDVAAYARLVREGSQA